MWIAPGIRPSVHSSNSRMSTRSGGSPRREARARERRRLRRSRSAAGRAIRGTSASLEHGTGAIPGYARAVASGRVVGIVALCAVAAVVVIVGGTVLLSRHESTTPRRSRAGNAGPAARARPAARRRGAGARPGGNASRRAEAAEPAQAAAIFRRYTTVEARLGLAFAEWTGPSEPRARSRRSPTRTRRSRGAHNLGLADFQAGRNADAASAWQKTASRFPDSPYAVDALDALQSADVVVPGLPPSSPTRSRRSREGPRRSRGRSAGWDLKHVVTARRLLDAAAALAPDSPGDTRRSCGRAVLAPSPKAPFPHPRPAERPGSRSLDSPPPPRRPPSLERWRSRRGSSNSASRSPSSRSPSTRSRRAPLLEALGHK